MKTIKGSKKDLIKEYLNFCKDLNFNRYSMSSKNQFSIIYIENELKMNGLFCNENLKTININEIKNEIIYILKDIAIKF